jgi:hypothetical protein
MKRFCLLSTLIAFCASSAFSIAATDSTAAKAPDVALKTVKAGNFSFSWKIDGANLVATVSCKTPGWVAVGFNPKNVMQDANMIVGTLVNGKADVSDQFGDGMFSHKPDTAIGGKNNILVGDFTQANGVSMLSFTIPLNSGDPKDCVLAAGATINVIFASGEVTDTKKKHKDDSKTIITL